MQTYSVGFLPLNVVFGFVKALGSSTPFSFNIPQYPDPNMNKRLYLFGAGQTAKLCNCTHC